MSSIFQDLMDQCDEEEKKVAATFESSIKLLEPKIIPKLMKTSVLIAHLSDAQQGITALQVLYLQVDEEEFREMMPNIAKMTDVLNKRLRERLQEVSTEIDLRIPTGSRG